LSQIGAAAVPALIEALDQADSNVQREAAWALGQIGPAAEASVPVLTSLLQSCGGLDTSLTGHTRGAAEVTTAVVNVKPGPGDKTMVLSHRVPSQSGSRGDNKVGQAVAQALKRIQQKE